MPGLILPQQWRRQPQQPVSVDGRWKSRLKLAFLPSVGFANLGRSALPLQTSGDFTRGITSAGVTYFSGARAEYAPLLDASSGLTLISIFRARPAQYLGSDNDRYLLSNRTSGNTGWSWGRLGAVGGGATGNLTSQLLVMQGISAYQEANYTIESLVDTPVAVRYSAQNGLISWFRFGQKSSPDTAASAPSAGGNLVLGAQGDFASGLALWIDHSAIVLGFDGELTDAEIKALTESTAAPWQVFQAPARRIWISAGGGGTDTPVNPAVGTVALTGYAPTVAQTLNQALTPGVGGLAITGYAPTIAQPQAVSPDVGVVTITGYAPTVTQAINQAVNPGVGSIAITGYAPAIVQTANQAISPNVGSLAITGYAPSVVQASASQNILPVVGSLTITGYAPSVAQSGQTNFGGVPFFHSEYANTYRRKRAEEKVVAPATVEPAPAVEQAEEIEVAVEQAVAPSAISIAKSKVKRELQAELKRQEAAYQKLQTKQLEEQFQRQLEEERNALLVQELQMLIQKDLEEQDEEEAMLLLM